MKTTPVDSNPYTINKLQAEATHVLTIVTLIARLEKFQKNKPGECPIYLNCKGLINRILSTNINSPSMVISDHIDIILQIRREIKTMKTKIKLIHVQPPKIEMMEQATKEKK